jgi:cell division protein FtsI (penicillin-binding protein 3)
MQLDLKKGSRPKILAIVILAIMAVFVGRLFYLQVIRHDYYVAKANEEQLKQLVIPAKRGEIYALDGNIPTPLVLNETVYTVFADPKIADEPEKIAETIRRVAGGNARSNVDELLAKKESRYQIIATQVTRKQAEMIKQANLSGLGFQEESRRVYPEGQLAAQTLGFVNTEGTGQYGVEAALNDRLTGADGLLQSVTDVSNVPLTIGDNNINQPAKNGDNIVLTIDRNIQAYTEQALKRGMDSIGAEKGSVMVMDPQTGKVLAMANLPTYNPAEYYKVTDAAAFNNATISAPYEPGSDVKVLTMATGVDKGVVSPESTYYNTDSITVQDRTITNAHKGETGEITFQHALSWSLNTGFVTVAQRLGNDGNSIDMQARSAMYGYFHDRWGLGELTGIELAGEAAGVVLKPDQPGAAVQYSNMAFGQGLDVTMVQVCAAFSTIINGGTYYQPTVLAGTANDAGALVPAAQKEAKGGMVSAATSDTMRKMVHEARNLFQTNRENDKSGYYIGGKTGTSQVIRDGKYVDDETIATYLGYGGNGSGAGDPKYVIMVQVSGEHKYFEGATAAMPIFSDISNWMLDYLKLQPKG